MTPAANDPDHSGDGNTDGITIAVTFADVALRDHVLAALRNFRCHVVAVAQDDADVIVSDAMAEHDAPVVVIGSADVIAVALQDGAAGGLKPSFRAAQLKAVIGAVVLGLTCADVRATRRSRQTLHALADEAESSPSQLTARELEVMAQLITGAGNKQIARRLAISVHTVKFHVASIIAKLGATTRTDAVARALRAARRMV